VLPELAIYTTTTGPGSETVRLNDADEALVHGSVLRRIIVVMLPSGVGTDAVSETQPVQVREIPYRIRNWPEYKAGLRRRGDLTVWLSDDTFVKHLVNVQSGSIRSGSPLELIICRRAGGFV
jgi:hypothetical protein